MNKLLVFLLTFVTMLLAQAQQQQYAGLLLDAETGEPMAYANLYTESGTGTLANIDGRYVLMAKPDEQVRISFVGYATQTLRVDALPSVLKMQPLAKSLAEVTVLSTDAILMKVREQLRSDFAKY